MKDDNILFAIGKIQYKAQRFLTRALKARGLGELSPSHGEIIGALLMMGPLPMGDIARFIDKDKSTATTLVGKLERLGYVARARDPEDNRVTMIKLTDKGKALQPVIVEISQDLRQAAYQGLSDQEVQILYILLNKLNNGF